MFCTLVHFALYSLGALCVETGGMTPAKIWLGGRGVVLKKEEGCLELSGRILLEFLRVLRFV